MCVCEREREREKERVCKDTVHWGYELLFFLCSLPAEEERVALSTALTEERGDSPH